MQALVFTQDTSNQYLLGGTTSNGRFQLWRSHDLNQWQMLRLSGDPHFSARLGPGGYPSHLFAEPSGELLLVLSDLEFGLRYARFDPDRGTISLDLIKDAGLQAYAMTALQGGSYLLALEQPDGIDLRRYRRFQSPQNGANPAAKPIYTETEVDRAGNRWHRTFARSRVIAPDVTAIAGEADGRVWWGIETGVMSVRGRDFFFQDASMGFFTHNVADIRPCGDTIYFAALHGDQNRLAMARVSRSAGGRTDYAVEVIALPDAKGDVTSLSCSSGSGSKAAIALVGTADGHVFMVRRHEIVWRQQLAKDAAITAFAATATDPTAYIATAAGNLFEMNNGTVKPVASTGGVTPISALTIDRKGRLWMARDGAGLFRRDAKGWTHIAPDAFPYRSIASLHADPRRGVWVLPSSAVTSVGLVHVTDKQFQLYNPPSRRLARPIDIDVTADGNLWIGTALDGFYRLERARP